ncbi:MAG: hypothetical protein ACFE95_18890 [Candidatus Hodarchaeota archaeon]
MYKCPHGQYEYCPYIKRKVDFNILYMTPFQISMSKTIAKLASFHLPVEEEILNYLIFKTNQKLQVEEKLFMCCIHILPAERRGKLLNKALDHFRQELYRIFNGVKFIIPIEDAVQSIKKFYNTGLLNRDKDFNSGSKLIPTAI